jgi:hypothetical protein
VKKRGKAGRQETKKVKALQIISLKVKNKSNN